MRRFLICILLLVLMFSLAVSVNAETQASSVSTFATVTTVWATVYSSLKMHKRRPDNLSGLLFM